MALAARAQQEALLQLVSFASLSASFTAPALRPPIGPDLNLRHPSFCVRLMAALFHSQVASFCGIFRCTLTR